MIVGDSDDELTGEPVPVPDDINEDVERPVKQLPYVTWRPEGDSPADGPRVRLGRAERIQPVPQRAAARRGAVTGSCSLLPENTVREAWRGLIGGLLVAGAIAVPAAVLLGVLVSQYIATPLRRLTLASQRVAEGHFDVDVAVDRRDEVGRLSLAFSSMAGRVGSAQTQMRQLIANVSHDLKTPLTSILGFAQALRDGRRGGRRGCEADGHRDLRRSFATDGAPERPSAALGDRVRPDDAPAG